MTTAILDLRFDANTTHGSTTYFVRARDSLTDCGSWKDRITTSGKLGAEGEERGGGGEEDYAGHILRDWQRLARMIRE